MKFIIKLIYTLVSRIPYRDFFAILLYKVNLIPDEYKDKVHAMIKSKQYEKKFLKLNLLYNELGFHFLDPMPSKDFLKKYYKETYWQKRNDKNQLVRLRDVEHYNLLKRVYPDFDKDTKKILNFGAGHGGLSFLLHAANHEIHNFDLGETNNLFNERWNYINELEKITGKFDLIYGSHSLEHVQNIKEIMKKFNEISHENTIYFFEVPNDLNKKKIEPPHTYYFTRKFFYNCFEKYDYCQTVDALGFEKDDEGISIRFLSKHKISDTFLK